MIKRIQMRKVRKIIIIGVIIIIACIVSANIFLKKGTNNINIDENKLEIYDSSIADYVKKIDDGTKINISPKLNQDTKIDGLDIKNIQLTCKNGITTLLADIFNNTNKDSEIKHINIKLLNEENKEMRTVRGYIPALKIGETTKLNVSMSSNLITAYNIEFYEK